MRSKQQKESDGKGKHPIPTLFVSITLDSIVGKYISLEMLIERTKETYYEALQDSSIGWHENRNTYEPFVKYYMGMVIGAYKEFEKRVKLMQDRTLSKPDRIKAIIDEKVGVITKKEIAEKCPDISETTIERTLKDLLDSGYLQKIGGGRSTGYAKVIP